MRSVLIRACFDFFFFFNGGKGWEGGCEGEGRSFFFIWKKKLVYKCWWKPSNYTKIIFSQPKEEKIGKKKYTGQMINSPSAFYGNTYGRPTSTASDESWSFPHTPPDTTTYKRKSYSWVVATFVVVGAIVIIIGIIYCCRSFLFIKVSGLPSSLVHHSRSIITRAEESLENNARVCL